MTDREKVIAAYICYNEKLPDKRCEKCPYGYDYLDQTGDNYFVGCNEERIMVDAIDLLIAQEPKCPIRKQSKHGWFWFCYCPKCGASLNDMVRPKYCSECGQAVKWE